MVRNDGNAADLVRGEQPQGTVEATDPKTL